MNTGLSTNRAALTSINVHRVTHNFLMKSRVSLSLAIMSAKICCTPVSMSWGADSPLDERENKSKGYRSVFKSIIESQ